MKVEKMIKANSYIFYVICLARIQMHCEYKILECMSLTDFSLKYVQNSTI